MGMGREGMLFVSGMGRLRFKVLPFGLKVAAFQKVMEMEFTNEMKEGILCIYIDDFIVVRSTELECCERTRKVPQKMLDLRLNGSRGKLQLCAQEIKVLGHIVSDGRLAPGPGLGPGPTFHQRRCGREL